MSKPVLSQLALVLCVVGAVMLFTARTGATLPAEVVTITGADGTRDVIPAQHATLDTRLRAWACGPWCSSVKGCAT